ncbi:unnamed protein product [Timema podura]|nr:unnamed protein product [Timema podura]
MLRQLMLLLLGAAMVAAQRRLALPDPKSCANSTSLHGFLSVSRQSQEFVHQGSKEVARL